jgi:hypothetical protein
MIYAACSSIESCEVSASQNKFLEKLLKYSLPVIRLIYKTALPTVELTSDGAKIKRKIRTAKRFGEYFWKTCTSMEQKRLFVTLVETKTGKNQDYLFCS